MQAERWKQVEALFQAAQQRPPDQRAAFLGQACPDDLDLRTEVESLLKAAESRDPLLDGSPLSSMAERPPALRSGDKLGNFEIVAMIGRGGMGEVYRAHDLRLKRDVAIKTLPSGFASDRDRIARFEREARAASALNHPNIVSVYDIGTEGGVSFIVSELVDGETLARLISRGPLPLRNLIEVGTQICDGLAAAHAAGVIHRDLKPGNIMLTRDGRVKILDFGLARQDRARGGDSSTMEASQPGTILGTPGYMSPEQVRGESADARSDIFSLGVILYELTSGKPAFHGTSSVELMNSILKDDPPELPPASPPALERIVRRCIEKQTAKRFQSAADLGFALQSLSAPMAPVATPKRRSRRTAIVVLAGAGLLVLAAVAGWWLIHPRATTEFIQLIPVPLTAQTGYEDWPSFSPDGNQLAYQGTGNESPNGTNARISVKSIGSGNALQLTTPGRSCCPAWSPDGRAIAFLRFHDGDTDIYSISPIGGIERKVADGLAGIGRISWSPDGRFLVTAKSSPPSYSSSLYLVDVENGSHRRLIAPPDEKTSDDNAAISPDGHLLVFTRTGRWYKCGLYLMRLGADYLPVGEPRLLRELGGQIEGLAWTADGKEIVYSLTGAGALMRLRIEAGTPPQSLAFGGQAAFRPAISRHGSRLAYVENPSLITIWQIQPGTPPRRFAPSRRGEDHPQYSPDGKRVVFDSNRSGLNQIWVCDQDGGNAFQLTSFNVGSNGTPRWSPDGRWIAFDRVSKDGQRIFLIAPDGGHLRRLTTGPGDWDEMVPSFSSDGKSVYYASNQTGRNEIWRAPAQGGNGTQITHNGGSVAFESRDGQFLYYTRDASSGVWELPLGGGQERLVVQSIHDRTFAVVGDGVYYFLPHFDEGVVEGVPSLRFRSFRTGKDVEIARVKLLPEEGMSVSPDRKSILVSGYIRVEANVMVVDNFR